VCVTFTFGPLFLAAVWFGGIPLLVAVCIVVGAGTWEYCRMQEHKGLQPWTVFGIAASLAWCVSAHLQGAGAVNLPALLILGLLAAALGKRGVRVADLGATLLGIFYVGFLGSFAIRIRNLSDAGLSQESAAGLTILVMLGIWASDIAAFFAGRWLGRRHPFPHLSPGKTDAGFVGAVLGALAVVVWGGWASGMLPLWQSIGLGLLVGVGSPVGDLVESMMKREAGVKDASGIIPGHGGVLDRFDSFLFVCPLAYLYLALTMSS